MATSPFLVPLFSLFCLISVVSSEIRYQRGNPVELYVNKVGPYHNPQETYHYYQLPVCSPKKIRHKSLSLGEVLNGDRMAESMYEIRFRENVDKKVLCEMKLFPQQVERLRQAIEELYYFEFVVDDLPLRGFVGYMEESGFLPHSHKIGLWTHLDFHLEWNGDRIIYANVSVRDVKPTSLDDVRGPGPLSITHTYSVRWSETTSERRGERRGSRGGDDGFFPRTLEIHWLSIINSMVLVFLLVGFVVVILMRVLKNDLARYNLDEEASSSSSGDDFDQGDNGWKIIHTDALPRASLLAAPSLWAELGVGSQFWSLGTGIIADGAAGHVQRPPARRHQLSRHPSLCPHLLHLLVMCPVTSTVPDRRRNLGMEHSPDHQPLLCSVLPDVERGQLGALGQRLDAGAAGHHHLPVANSLAPGGLSPHGHRGHLRQEPGRPLRRALPHQEHRPRDPSPALVQVHPGAHDYWGLPALQCHFRGVVLHLCHSVGSGAVHPLRDPVLRLRHPPQRRGLHLHRPHLLPVIGRGLPLVVAVCAECRLHRPLHLPLLRLLLLAALQYVRSGADCGVLWLLAPHGLRLLPHAGDDLLLCLAQVHPLHLHQPQDGLSRRPLPVGRGLQ
uniref:Uncharacterized protein n=1 Tax=Sphaerodactylus townsendi TaxID=933632 RepID=A0ACB8EWD3_9SAUR